MHSSPAGDFNSRYGAFGMQQSTIFVVDCVAYAEVTVMMSSRTKSLVSKRLEDRNQSLGLGLETKSLGTLNTFASIINLFCISVTVNLSIVAPSEYDCMSLISILRQAHTRASIVLYLLILQ